MSARPIMDAKMPINDTVTIEKSSQHHPSVKKRLKPYAIHFRMISVVNTTVKTLSSTSIVCFRTGLE
jgi:hypothetical protein